MFKNVKERIITLNQSNHIHPILMIDEAHLLSNDILQEIRLLTNFEIDSVNALTVLFCGMDSFNMKLGLSILESLANSVTISIFIDSLKKEETFSFIEKRISDCGNTNRIFTKNALELIHQVSGGILRIISRICYGALLNAYYSKSETIEAEHIKSIVER